MNPRPLRLAHFRRFSSSPSPFPNNVKLSAWAILSKMTSSPGAGLCVHITSSGAAGKTPIEEALPTAAKALNKSLLVVPENDTASKLPKDGSVDLLIASKHTLLSRHVYRALRHGGTIVIYSDSSAVTPSVKSDVKIEQSVAAAIFRNVRIVGFELGCWAALHPQEAREGAEAVGKM